MAAIHTFRNACVARIKCAHPANGDGTAASILKDLRRIKSKPQSHSVKLSTLTVVASMIFSPCGRGSIPPATCYASGMFLKEGPGGIPREIHSRPNGKDWDIPHVSKGVGFLCVHGSDGGAQFPAFSGVVRVVHQNTTKVAALINVWRVIYSALTGAQQHVKGTVLFPDLGSLT